MAKEVDIKIKNAIHSIYKEYFEKVEAVIEEEFGLTLGDISVKSQKRPLPYIRAICARYLNDIGVPMVVIGERLNCNHSTLSLWNGKYDDSYKYNSEFRLIADRFNKRLKEKENGTTQL
jgi:hypothetical protein